MRPSSPNTTNPSSLEKNHSKTSPTSVEKEWFYENIDHKLSSHTSERHDNSKNCAFYENVEHEKNPPAQLYENLGTETCKGDSTANSYEIIGKNNMLPVECYENVDDSKYLVENSDEKDEISGRQRKDKSSDIEIEDFYETYEFGVSIFDDLRSAQ